MVTHLQPASPPRVLPQTPRHHYSMRMSEEQETSDQSHPSLENKVIIMNGFSYDEITQIMRTVKGLFESPRDLIFAKTTENSLEMKLKDLIIDMSEDHEYLKNNPPNAKARNSEDSSGSS